MTKIIKIIFAFILFLFPFGEILRFNLGNGILIRPLDIGVGIVLVLWLISKFIKRERLSRKRILLPILLFSGSGLLSLLINYSSLNFGQFTISLMYLVRWIAYAGMFFIIVDFDENFKKTINNLLVLIGFLIVAAGYVQYFLYPNLRNLYYLGWDDHLYRMFSVFLDPNFAGAFFVLFFLLLVSRFLKKKSILIGVLSILTLGAVFLTFSRSALIMLIVSSSILFVLMNKKRLMLVLLLIIFIVLAISSRYFNIENINLFRTTSSEARVKTANDTITVIEKNPIFGVGFNAYRYAQLRYGLRTENSVIVSHADAGTDNSFLFVAATTGLLGSALFIFMWIGILKREFRGNPIFVASVAGVFVNSLFVNSLFYPFIMFWIWTIFALSTKSHN